MNKIYLEIAKLTDKFRTMSYRLTTDENKINEAVQELMLYFMQMNPETLKGIWEKDGKDGAGHSSGAAGGEDGVKFSYPKSKIFVGGLDFKLTSEELKDHFT